MNSDTDAVISIKIDENDIELSVNIDSNKTKKDEFIPKDELNFGKSVIFPKKETKNQYEAIFSPLGAQEKKKKEGLIKYIGTETNCSDEMNSEFKGTIENNNLDSHIVLEEYMKRFEHLAAKNRIRKKFITLQEKVSQLKQYKSQINSEVLDFFNSYQEEIRIIFMKSLNSFQKRLKKYLKIFTD